MDELEKLKADLILKPLNSAQELQDWMYTYLDIKFPMGVVYPGSTHGPIDAMWRIYNLMKTGGSRDVPQVCMLASRDSYKTLSAAAIEVLCMIHFEISVAHGAAIKSQSEKAIQYVNSFFRKVGPYLEENNWKKISDSKAKIEWLTDKGDAIYLRIVVATVAGMNCISPYAFVDTDRGVLLAKDVLVEDVIKTYDYIQEKQVFNPIKKIGYTIKEARKIILSNGAELILSDDHQVFTQRGWITADQLRVGYKLHTEEKTKGTNCKQEVFSLDIDKRLDQMVLGQLLGDASLNFLPSGSVRFQVSHTKDQLEYLNDTKNIFEINGIHCNICEDKNNQFKLTTQCHDFFKNISSITHINGKKILTKEWIKLLTPESFSYLIMDDGTVNSKKIGVHKSQGIKISTFNFSKEENMMLVDKFKEYGFEASLWKKDKYTGVKLSKNSSRELSTVIRPYFSNCLKYKLLPPLEHSQFTREIDTGNIVLKTEPSSGFTWSNSSLSNLKYGRNLRKSIKNNLNTTIEKIELIGKQELIDIQVDTNNEHQKSFYANGVLVHNSEHVPMLFMDEIDVVQDPRALEEAKMIPSVYKNYFPLTVYLSTRKYAGGLMEKTLKDTERSGGEVLRWNIIDVTERLTNVEARTNEEKVLRYISRELPLQNLSPEEFAEINEESRDKYKAIEAYAGIAEHPMLSVMHNWLVDRPQGDFGNLYKPIFAVHNNFKQTSPEMGEAQLLCNKPSSSGLVYPRFCSVQNAIGIDEAWEYLSGDKIENKTLDELVQYMHNLGIEFYGAADWGDTDETAIGVFVKIAGGKAWLIDMTAAPGMEIPEIKEKLKELTEIYKVQKWFCDSNYPAYIKMLRKTDTVYGKIPAIGVKKGPDSVIDGITAVKAKIVDANNNRHFKVLKTRNNERVFDSFETYKLKLDGKGNPIDGKPEHGKDGVADIMDMIRYFHHSMFGRGSKVLFSYDLENIKGNPRTLQNKINDLTGNKTVNTLKSGKKKGIVWDI